MTDVDTELRRVLAATEPRQLFGTADDAGQPTPRARAVFRDLARRLHPDRCADPAATRAFAHLSRLWAEHRRGGDERIVVVAGRRYRLRRRLAVGDLANLYSVRADDGTEAVLKLARDPGDTDLIEAEASALRHFAEHVEARFAPYLPRLSGTMTHVEPGSRARRAANLLPHLDGFVSLARVAAVHPDGLDPRDAAWMWRRLLVALGAAHRAGIVHGAVLPEHVLIHPEQHGLVLVDWCYHATEGGRVPALVTRHASRYPAEIRDGAAAEPASDIHLATVTMTDLIGDRLPKRLRAFARGCTGPTPGSRPDDAWRLLSEFDELLHDLYGPRRFRPFTMPRTTG